VIGHQPNPAALRTQDQIASCTVAFGQRFLYQDVLTGFDGLRGQRMMRAGRSCDRYGVNLRVFQDLLDFGVDGDVWIETR